MAIVDRLDIQLHPEQAEPGQAGQARVGGWIRFRDGREPDPLACLLFVDAFPPPVFGLFGAVGWVPTVELTVHVRCRPAPGWILGSFHAHGTGRGSAGRGWRTVGQHRPTGRAIAPARPAAPDDAGALNHERRESGSHSPRREVQHDGS
jgi:hypothetical protein